MRGMMAQLDRLPEQNASVCAMRTPSEQFFTMWKNYIFNVFPKPAGSTPTICSSAGLRMTGAHFIAPSRRLVSPARLSIRILFTTTRFIRTAQLPRNALPECGSPHYGCLLDSHRALLGNEEDTWRSPQLFADALLDEVEDHGR